MVTHIHAAMIKPI